MILVCGAGGRVQIEYVRSRRALKVWVGDKKDVQPVELTLDDFCERLAIEPHLIVGDRCFLLFAGPLDASPGGRHGLAGVFQCEGDAREAFVALRRSQPAAAGWGQLVAIDERAAVRMLAWFGEAPGQMPGDSGEPPPLPAPRPPAQAARLSRARSWAAARRRIQDEPVDRPEEVSSE